MRSITLTLVMVTMAAIDLFAESPSQLSYHRPNYLLLGRKFYNGTTTGHTKLQTSFKAPLLKARLGGVPFTLGGSLTTTIFLDLHTHSAPIREQNYNTGLFLQLDQGWLKNVRLVLWDHESTGERGVNSRGWNRLILGIKLTEQQSRSWQYQVWIRSWIPWSIGRKTSTIQNYRRGEFRLSFDRRDQAASFLRGGSMLWRPGSQHIGNFEVNVELNLTQWLIERIMTVEWFGIYTYLQMWHGYGESLQGYNRKTTSLSIGISVPTNGAP